MNISIWLNPIRIEPYFWAGTVQYADQQMRVMRALGRIGMAQEAGPEPEAGRLNLKSLSRKSLKLFRLKLLQCKPGRKPDLN